MSTTISPGMSYPLTYIDRINFNNDTVTGVQRGSLTVQRQYIAGATGSVISVM